ncbi:WD repeat-containing protein 37 [Ciona intestinalis]
MEGTSVKKEDKKQLPFGRASSKDKDDNASQNENYRNSKRASALPRRVRTRLHSLFDQIEDEFSEIYTENTELRKTITALNEKLQTCDHGPSDKNELPPTNGLDILKSNIKGKSSGISSSQLSQRLKTTYKTGTSKLVSSFKPSANVICKAVQEFRGHKDGIWDVSSSQVNVNIAGSASADQKAKLWNTQNGECVATYHGHSGSVNCLRFHPEKQVALTVSGDTTAQVWSYDCSGVHDELNDHDNVEDSAPQDSQDYHNPLICVTCHTSPVVGCDWLMDGVHFVTASWDRTSCLIDSSTSQTVQTLSGHDLPLTYVSAHSKQKLIVTSSKDATFRVCDFRVPTVHTVIVGQGHTQSISSAVFTNDEKIVSSSDDRCVKVWDLKSMRAPIASMRFDSPVNRISVSRRGVIVIPHDNRQIRLYDTNGARIARLPRNDRTSHRRVVTAATWVEGATPSVLTCGWDKLIIGWNIEIPNSLTLQK